MAKKMTAPAADNAPARESITLIDEILLKNKVYTIRGVKVMLDADLAEIYGYSVKAFNQQVKNNIFKFPEDFRFQLSEIEVETLSRSNYLTSMQVKGMKGGRTYLPYAFTEQGIYMLMTVLKGDLATKQSLAIVRLFKSMKDYIVAENQQLLGCANCAQIATLTAQNTKEIAAMRSGYEALKAQTDSLENETRENRESLAKIMDNFIDPTTFKQFHFLNGQKLEADVANTQIYSLAKESVIVIDNYLGVKTLDLLRCVAPGVKVTILSDQYAGCRLTPQIVADFRAARPDVVFDPRPAQDMFHDRYVVVDFDTANERMFHCGSSSKDAGGKICSITQLDDIDVFRSVIKGLLSSKTF